MHDGFHLEETPFGLPAQEVMAGERDKAGAAAKIAAPDPGQTVEDDEVPQVAGRLALGLRQDPGDGDPGSGQA